MFKLEDLSKMYGKKFAYIDFEFRGSEESQLELVAAVVRGSNMGNKPLKFWLWDSYSGKQKLKNLLQDIKDTHILVCFGAPAESRSFLSLGLDIRKFDWIDLRAEFQAFSNRNDDLMYGELLKKGRVVKTIPPPFDESRREPGQSYENIEFNLVEIVYKLTKVRLDAKEKDEMRDLILTAEEFTEKNMVDILNYCAIDVEYLPLVHEKLAGYVPPDVEVSRKFMEKIHRAALFRGRYCAYTGYSEHVGIPLDMPAIENLSKNYQAIKVDLIRECNESYEFFRYDPKKKAYIQDYSRFSSYIESQGLGLTWPQTDGGKRGKPQYKADEKTLDNFRFYKPIDAFRRCKKDLGQIRWYRPEALPEFYSVVGSDGRLRPWFGPYGTQTARNAPPAKRYIPAQSAWLRAVMRPPPGYAITGYDWGSQEFAIAAVISNDRNMIDAYMSGDPYLYFAKLAKAVPPEGTRETHGPVRDLFKATCLGHDTLVRVKGHGWKLVGDVMRDDLLWDGNTWRKTRGGSWITGRKKTIHHCGINITENHEVYADGIKTQIGTNKQRAKILLERSAREVQRCDLSWSEIWALARYVGRVFAEEATEWTRILCRRVLRRLRH